MFEHLGYKSVAGLPADHVVPTEISDDIQITIEKSTNNINIKIKR
jgi:hypothetical protein